MGEPIEYKGFTIVPVTPHKRRTFRIYDSIGTFKAVLSTEKNAKRKIDFCLEKGLWHA